MENEFGPAVCSHQHILLKGSMNGPMKEIKASVGGAGA